MENESFECAWGDRLFHGPGPVWHETRLVHSVSHCWNSFDFEFSRSFSTWGFTVRLRSPKESLHLTNDWRYFETSRQRASNGYCVCSLITSILHAAMIRLMLPRKLILTYSSGRNRILLMGRECWVCIWASFILVLSHLRLHKSFILLYSLDSTFHLQSASH